MAAVIFLLLAVMASSAISNPFKSDALVYPDNIRTGGDTDRARALYEYVVVGNYEYAIKTTFDLQKINRSDIISTVVNRLLNGNVNNTVDFAYKLWYTFGKEIVENYFPVEFSLILSSRSVRIISGAMSKVWYLGVDDDESGSFAACDNSSSSKEWKFEPIWDGNRVYYRILNVDRNLYFNDTNMRDSKITSAQWNLNPEMNNTALKFYFIRRTERDADETVTFCNMNRDLYDSNVISEEEFLGWYIRLF